VCPTGLRVMSEHYGEHCVSDWTACDVCEHIMGGIVCPTGLRVMSVNTMGGIVCPTGLFLMSEHYGGHCMSDWTACDE